MKIKKEAVEDILPLTPMQEGILFYYLSDPKSEIYFQQLSLNITGSIAVDMFKEAWIKVVEKNESLRTVFRWNQVKKPIQIILKSHSPEIDVYDFSSLSVHADLSQIDHKSRAFLNDSFTKHEIKKLPLVTQKQQVSLLIEKLKKFDRKNKFDLQKVPLRITLIRFASKCVLLLTYHHILFDGWSTGTVLKEFFVTYTGLKRGWVTEISAKPHFSDFMKISGRKRGTKAEQEFWRNYLKGYDFNHARQVIGSAEPIVSIPKVHTHNLPHNLTFAIREFVSREQITISTLLSAAWGILLQQYEYRQDVIFGTTVSGRDLEFEGIEEMVGLLINTVPTRIKLQKGSSVSDFLKSIHSAFQTRREFEQSSITDIKEICGITGSASFFNTILIVENYPLDSNLVGKNEKSLQPYELSIDDFSVSEFTNFDVTVTVSFFEKAEIKISYNKEFISKENADSIGKHFENIIQEMILNPKLPVEQINILSPSEKEKIITAFNNTHRDYEKYACVHELFMRQAIKTPKKTAIVCGNLQITYDELETKANYLAWILRSKGVTRNSLVGLLTGRSADMIVAILAVLKAGGAYLPLDINYPVTRLNSIIQDSQPFLLIAQQDKSRIEVDFQGEIIDLTNLGQYSSIDTINPIPNINESSDLIYMIYTSGSTGNPKGVMLTHRNVNNFIQGASEVIDFSQNKSIASVTTISFDIFVLESLLPLTKGMTIVVAEEKELKSPELLNTLLQKKKIKMLQTTPSRLKLLLESTGDRKGLRGLSDIMVGGESLANDVLDELRKNTSAKIYNMYGPTETTVWSTIKELTNEDQISIGKPINNTEIFILGPNDVPLPIGVPGQLCIGGDSVALGYFNNKQLTDQKFVTIPSLSKGKIYKTGDLAKWLSDGTIVFQGRIDSQIKIRGFRIELGEIEQALRSHPNIKEAVTLIKEYSDYDKRIIAYIISNKTIDSQKLRQYLLDLLPEYMIPSDFKGISTIPFTPNGKIDRIALASSEIGSIGSGVDFVPAKSSLEKTIASIWKEVLDVSTVGVNDNFFDLGGNSLLTIQIVSRLKKHVTKKLKVLDLFRYTTIKALAEYLTDDSPAYIASKQEPKATATKSSDIAVIGMACRFPGAASLDDFWVNLKNGVESISFFSDMELQAEGVQQGLLKKHNYVKAKGIIDGVEFFDANFFSYSRREAELMDPQLRILHECCWHALEDAGYYSGNYKGSIGLYAGSSTNLYWLNQLYSDVSDPTEEWQIANINGASITMPISYKLDLNGPSVSIETTCSTSLVAIHTASQALLARECDMAIAGGVSILLPKKAGYLYKEGMIRSPDGHCRAFDDRAQGTVSGDGAGLVVLKPLSAAIEDGDYIYSVIKGTAVNNDGLRKIGYTAPSITGQSDVIQLAHRKAKIDPNSLGYVEAHGTGTALGDPIEFEALNTSFNTKEKNYCGIGSVKTNIGHLGAAAGVAGFIKTVLSLHHKYIPPSLHFDSPNSRIDLDNSPFYVNTHLKKWPVYAGTRRAGVSSFGIGGTNAHVILEQAPKYEKQSTTQAAQLILVSGNTEKSLRKNCLNLYNYLNANPDLHITNLAYTLQARRKHFKHRISIVGSTHEGITSALRAMVFEPFANVSKAVASDKLHIIFMFPGQGAQYPNMGHELYEREPVFRKEINKGLEVLSSLGVDDLKPIIYPESNSEKKAAIKLINQTQYTQPLLFLFEYAISKLLKSWGITPQAMIGHSLGEYVVACLAGVFSFEDGLNLTASRGRLMQSMEKGSMLSVAVDINKLHGLLAGQDNLSIAALNSQNLSVVSGPDHAISAFKKQLDSHGIFSTQLHTSHAFHSHMMDPALQQFEDLLKDVEFHPPQIPYLSNLTGDWISPEQATDSQYWAKHFRQTVNFVGGIDKLLEYSNCVFIEIGPGKTLKTFVKEHCKRKNNLTIINTIKHPQQVVTDTEYLLRKIGLLWEEGVSFDWKAYNSNERKRKIPLPPYAFDRNYYWKYGVNSKKLAGFKAQSDIKNEISDWFYTSNWVKTCSILNSTCEQSDALWLLFHDETSISKNIQSQLTAIGADYITIQCGDRYLKKSDCKYVIRPHVFDDFYSLLNQVTLQKDRPVNVVHLWNYLGVSDFSDNNAIPSGFASLFYLARAIGYVDSKSQYHIVVATKHMEAVTSEDTLFPLTAILKGLIKVIPQEYHNITTQTVDIGSRILSTAKQVASALLSEFTNGIGSVFEQTVAYRKGQRFIQRYNSITMAKHDTAKNLLRTNGVYLITGGLGGMGLVLADYLAKNFKANLILTGRSFFPPVNEWEDWLSDHGQDPISQKIIRLKTLVECGAKIITFSADVSNLAAMKEVFSKSLKAFNRIDGVIHCAGLADAGMIQSRDMESIKRILLPKVQGAIVLKKIIISLGNKKPGFLMLCSSISSILGAFGQVGYVAANAFLDALAHANNRESECLTISINWDTWQEVGMAVKPTIGEFLSQPESKSTLVDHPLLDCCVATASNQLQKNYITRLSVKNNWLLDEHRIMGKAVFPATGYVEIAIAAFNHYTCKKHVQIKEIFFMEPLFVEESEHVEITTILTKLGAGYEFIIKSKGNSFDDTWTEHARGKIEESINQTMIEVDIEDIQTRCSRVFEHKGEPFKSHTGQMTFGPRWGSLQHSYYGQDEALVTLLLPEQFAEDLSQYTIHPALMDLASSFFEQNFSDGESYLPFCYRNLEIIAPFPAKISSFATYKPNDSKETITFSLLITDEHGTVLAKSEEFTLKRTKKQAHSKLQIPRSSNYELNIEQPGDLNSLKLNPSVRETLKAGEVEIETLATGLNFKEVLMSLGMLSVPKGFNPALGLECAGTISSVGPGVKDFIVGDEVIALTSNGFGRYVKTRVNTVYAKPPNLTFEESAAIPVSFMTAYMALVIKGHVKKREKILIHAATGGVGLAAVRIAQWIGAELYVTAGSQRKREYLAQLGIKHIFDSRSLAFADQIMDTTAGKGVDVILNSLSGEAFIKSLSILAPYGRFLEIGVRDILSNHQLGMKFFSKGRSFIGINLGDEFPRFREIFQDMLTFLKDGELEILPISVFDLNSVREAFHYMAGAKHIGKIVIAHKSKKSMDRLNLASRQNHYNNKNLEHGILNNEGVDVFSRVCNHNSFASLGAESQVIVSTHNLEKRLEKQFQTGFKTFQQTDLSSVGISVTRPRPKLTNEYVLPVTDNEKELVRVFEQFLGIDQIGIYDNFFELGASSLDVIQIHSQVEQLFKKEFSVVSMYSYPTIKQLADYLTEAKTQTRIVEGSHNKNRSKQALNKTMTLLKGKR